MLFGDEQDAAGEASGDFEQVGVLDRFVGFAEAFDEDVDDGALGFGVVVEDALEVGAFEAEEFGVLDGACGGGAGAAVGASGDVAFEQGHFAEHVAFAEDGEDDVAFGGEVDADGAGGDDEHGVAGVAAVEDVAAGAVSAGLEVLGEVVEHGGLGALEEGDLLEALFGGDGAFDGAVGFGHRVSAPLRSPVGCRRSLGGDRRAVAFGAAGAPGGAPARAQFRVRG